MDRYQTIKKVGDGAYGTVIKAVNLKSNDVCAIKKMKKKFYNWEECMSLKELKSLRKLNHQNIVKLKEVIKVSDELYFVFEYLEKNLYEVYTGIRDKGQAMTENQIRTIIYQIASALAYMHKHGFFHRDLKPENIMLQGDVAKLADFGLAREIRSRPPYTEYVSTRWYRAPELLLRSNNYNSPVDIWALGCIMAELYLMGPLFNGSSEVDQIHKICQILGTPNSSNWNDGLKLASQMNFSFTQYSQVPLSTLMPNACSEAIQLISEMLRYDPQKRPSAHQICQHPYFLGIQVPQRPLTPLKNITDGPSKTEADSSTIEGSNKNNLSHINNSNTIGQGNMGQSEPLSIKKPSKAVGNLLPDLNAPPHHHRPSQDENSNTSNYMNGRSGRMQANARRSSREGYSQDHGMVGSHKITPLKNDPMSLSPLRSNQHNRMGGFQPIKPNLQHGKHGYSPNKLEPIMDHRRNEQKANNIFNINNDDIDTLLENLGYPNPSKTQLGTLPTDRENKDKSFSKPMNPPSGEEYGLQRKMSRESPNKRPVRAINEIQQQQYHFDSMNERISKQPMGQGPHAYDFISKSTKPSGVGMHGINNSRMSGSTNTYNKSPAFGDSRKIQPSNNNNNNNNNSPFPGNDLYDFSNMETKNQATKNYSNNNNAGLMLPEISNNNSKMPSKHGQGGNNNPVAPGSRMMNNSNNNNQGGILNKYKFQYMS